MVVVVNVVVVVMYSVVEAVAMDFVAVIIIARVAVKCMIVVVVAVLLLVTAMKSGTSLGRVCGSSIDSARDNRYTSSSICSCGGSRNLFYTLHCAHVCINACSRLVKCTNHYRYVGL